MGAKINAQSQSDGLKSSNAEEDGKGYIAIESGEFNITAVSDAIQAETELIINGGTFDIKQVTAQEILTRLRPIR